MFIKHLPCFIYLQCIVSLIAHDRPKGQRNDGSEKLYDSPKVSLLGRGRSEICNSNLADSELRLCVLHDATSCQTKWFRGQNTGWDIGDLVFIPNVKSYGRMGQRFYLSRVFFL